MNKEKVKEIKLGACIFMISTTILLIILISMVAHECPKEAKVSGLVEKMDYIDHDDPFVECGNVRFEDREDSNIIHPAGYTSNSYSIEFRCRYKDINFGKIIHTLKEYQLLKEKIKHTMKGIKDMSEIKDEK